MYMVHNYTERKKSCSLLGSLEDWSDLSLIVGEVEGDEECRRVGGETGQGFRGEGHLKIHTHHTYTHKPHTRRAHKICNRIFVLN